MKSRCYLENSSSRKYYFDRGITICDEWLNDPKSFVIWAIMFGGYFEGSIIDRINNDKGYSPDNIRFVTTLGSLNNKRKTIRFRVDETELPLAEWSRKTGIKYTKLLSLYHRDKEALADLIRSALDDNYN